MMLTYFISMIISLLIVGLAFYIRPYVYAVSGISKEDLKKGYQFLLIAPFIPVINTVLILVFLISIVTD